jgi:prephenate dehydrogenase
MTITVVACRRKAHALSVAVARLLQDHSQGSKMIRKLSTGEYRLYSRRRNPKTGRRRNLGTFRTRAAAEKHERAVQFFKRGG